MDIAMALVKPDIIAECADAKSMPFQFVMLHFHFSAIRSAMSKTKKK